MALLKKSTLVLALVAGSFLSWTAVAKGKLGFVTKVDVSGILSPVLKHVKVASVAPASPAAMAGMRPGDYIIEADGHAVAGSPAREMAERIRGIKPGERLRLKLQRGPEVVVATIVAGP